MINVIPMVNKYQLLNKKIIFSNFEIIIDNKFLKDVACFNKELLNKLNVNEKAKQFSFVFEKNAKLKKEEYRIQCLENKMNIQAKNGLGFYYATRTLAQLLSLNDNQRVNEISFDAVDIIDKPRFAHRGFMIDVSRHFFTIEEIKKTIKLMANLKMNYFHWHLSDDQGFRIDFPEFRYLKDIASKRSRTKINGLEDDDYENVPYEYCYSIAEVKEVIEYAKVHHIEIIPEIDVPGHTTAIVAAYPHLHCFNKQGEVGTSFGVFKEIMCPSKETTYEFVEKLFAALVKLFKDSKYIHIGGDEVDSANWKECEDCKKKAEELGLENEKLLQTYFTNRLSAYLKSLGKKVISWHDGLQDNTDSEVIEQYWTWEIDAKAINYINQGRPTIYSPCSQFYFNDPYAELPLKTTYWKKVDLDGLTKEGRKNIFGVSGCIWTEWIPHMELLEVLINPRIEALAEVGWTNRKNMNFNDFLRRFKEFTKVLDTFNIAYASEKIALAKGKKYREKIAKKFRKNDKFVEYNLYLKQKKKVS